MELHFNLGTLVPGGAQPPVAKLENKKLLWARKLRQQPDSIELEQAIDKLGHQAAQAQSLKRPVTTFKRFADASDEQALYLLWENKEQSEAAVNGTTEDGQAKSAEFSTSSILLGYLKIVRDRRLYLVDEHGKRYVQTPLCVLDFYIHNSQQHHGKGSELFSAMLQSEQVEATKCAFDKPTPQLLSFLARHFQLENPIWQPTAFVVFPAFFDGLQPEAEGKNSDADANKRPLTALERHRRSVNEHYNGSPPAQSTARHSPRAAQRDIAGEIIHGTGQLPARTPAQPDTPQGRKAMRDYGHQKIW